MKKILTRVCRLIDFCLLELALYYSISISLSYFWWSPLGYEPCGMQAIGWFLLIYPFFLFCLGIRIFLTKYLKLSSLYILPPLLTAILYLPIAYFDGKASLAITTNIIGLLLMILFPIYDMTIMAKRITNEKNIHNRNCKYPSHH